MDVDELLQFGRLVAPVATGVAGFLGGLFSESLKAGIKNRREQGRLKRALCSEVVVNYNHLFNFIFDRGDPSANTRLRYPGPEQWVCLDCWREAQQNPVSLHQLREADTFIEVYFGLEHLKTLDGQKQVEAAGHLFRYIDSCVDSGRLPRKRFALASVHKEQFRHPVWRFVTNYWSKKVFDLCTRNAPPGPKFLSPARNLFVLMKRIYSGKAD